METIETATAPKVFNGEEKQKLTQLIREGIQVSREIDSLREGLSDAVKALAEEFEVKPSALRKCIKIAYKAEWDKLNAEFEQLDSMLSSTGFK